MGRHREFSSALIGMKRSFSALFFFSPLLMSYACREETVNGAHSRRKKKKAVSPSVHCTYSSMNVKKKKKNGTLLSSKGGGKDNLPASHPYFKIKTKEVPTFRGNVKHLFSRAYCGTYFFFSFFLPFHLPRVLLRKKHESKTQHQKKINGDQKKKKCDC